VGERNLRASRGLNIERTRAGRALRCALFTTLAALAAAVLIAGLPVASATAIFRAFSPTSPWNHTAVPTASGNPWAAQFTDRPGTPLRLSGTPDNVTYAAPIFFAQRTDPTAPVTVTQPDWLPDGDTGWDRRPIPVPLGVEPASGADGHLTVVSADRRTAWDFLGCTQAGPMGYVARVVVQWDLTGPGYSGEDRETSARGSGAPLINSSLRADEALNGIRHALGFTVPRVSSSYVVPATHSDGKQGSHVIKYGMRFVLRADYPVAANASVGVVNLIYALKTYGAYLVDQGADFEIDADFTHPEIWQQAGLNSKSLAIQPSDLRPAELGTPPPIPTVVLPVKQSRRPTVRLRANRRPIRVGARLHVSGRVRGQVVGYERVTIKAFTHGKWRFLLEARLKRDGRFATGTRLRLHLRPGRLGRTRALLVLRHLHFPPAIRSLRLRATVRGFGHSKVIHVGIRR
jgi:hypothetical protein